MTLNLKALLCSTYFPLISKPEDLGNPCLIISLLNYHNGILATLFSLFLPISLFSSLRTEIFWTSHFLWCFFCLNVSSAAFCFLNQAETWFTHSSKPIFLSSRLLFSVKFPVAWLLHDLWSSRPAHTWILSKLSPPSAWLFATSTPDQIPPTLWDPTQLLCFCEGFLNLWLKMIFIFIITNVFRVNILICCVLILLYVCSHSALYLSKFKFIINNQILFLLMLRSPSHPHF